jgi:hypothetical protein
MLRAISPFVLALSVWLLVAVAAHLVMSFGQTLIHYKIAHHPMGGKIFRNHINFHHTHYSDGHLVSQTYLGDEGNTTPYFFIPILLAGAGVYLLLPVDLFIIAAVACAASFYGHVYFNKEYHSEGSSLQRFAWFRRKQAPHFIHNRHSDCNLQ